ncbi:YdeI/OmpD-associated family protein [Crocinitomicaceae bacterium CZZ-1]|uniref:YdeI/OmpD-associated family protein n=1 Tax=Taishania pollutisoli TaxID=2766479 RepID=A0A8J6TY12_9FLAO|nr:YdeI/OmpD-associated family protein [Taishania pollutisoli]MBC9813286.1 YdeI/OmpD-associated family protein [Taishania pollutisoli]
MNSFEAQLEIIGINPFVFIPEETLLQLFQQSAKTKGPIRVKGTVNGKEYRQTLVRYKGEWRLYINLQMLANSPRRIGEKLTLTIAFDLEERIVNMHPKFLRALAENPAAKQAFEALIPSRRFEIIRYIAQLKTEGSVDRNVQKAILHLEGKGRFAGRDGV